MSEQPATTASTVEINPARGRGMLSWDGKRPLQEIPAPPARLVEIFNPAGDRARSNLLFHGDNKAVLAHLLASGWRGKVDLVYIDPPFDSGTNYARKVQLRGAPGPAGLVGKRASLGEQLQYSDTWTHDDYLQFMYERLLLLQELLADNGSLYIHLDSHRSHAIKLVCDEVFGPETFQREIVWRIGWVSGFKVRARNWIRNHDTILFYTKAGDGRFFFSKEHIPYPPGYTRRGGGPPAGPGYPIEDTWNCSDVDRLDSIQIMSFSRQKLDFPTQKNENLLARIIRASSPPGGLVLDCFAGSGTTAAVAQKLGRRWIACDIDRRAVQITARRQQTILLDQIDDRHAAGGSREPSPAPAALSFSTYEVSAGDRSALPHEAIDETGNPAGARGAHPGPSGGAQAARAEIRVRRVGEKAGTEGQPSASRACVEILDYCSPSIRGRLPKQGGTEPPGDWRAMVDSILIDSAYDGTVLTVTLADVPRRRADLVRGIYELEVPASETTVAVKIIDVLGEEVLITCAV